MADPDELRERVAVLETLQASTSEDLGSIEANGKEMSKELQLVQRDLTRLVTTATNMKTLITWAIPLSPALGVLFAKVIGI